MEENTITAFDDILQLYNNGGGLSRLGLIYWHAKAKKTQAKVIFTVSKIKLYYSLTQQTFLYQES